MNAVTVLTPGSRHRYREAWVGLFVLLGAISLMALLLTLTRPSMLRGRYIVYTSVTDASGLRRGDPVRMRGVNIGRVTGFQIAPGSVSIQLEVEKQFHIPADSRAQLNSANLLGETVVEVAPGPSLKPLEANQSIPGASGTSAVNKVNDLASEAVDTLERVQSLLNEQTVNNFQSSGAALNLALKDLAALVAEERDQLGELTASLSLSVKSVERATSGAKLERTVKQLDSLTARLDRSMQSMESVLARINRGEGSLGLLTKDNSLYQNTNEAVSSLKHAAGEMAQLAADIRKDPKKFLKISVF